MKIELFNKCRETILINLNNTDCFAVRPFESKMVSINSMDEFYLTIRKEESSFVEKNFFYKKYILSVVTKCIFSSIQDDIHITFTREIVRVTGDSYYDKIILSTDADFDEYYSVHNAEIIKAKYKKNCFFKNILISPFEHLTVLCILIFVLTIVFAVKIGLLFSCVFFIFAYFILWVIDNTVRKLSNFFGKKIFDIEDDKTEFNKILSEQYLNTFYQNDFLQAYNNDIYRDEL